MYCLQLFRSNYCKHDEQTLQGADSEVAWACLDEFNRIDIEVLSVIFQQNLVIRMALLRNRPFEPLEFEGDMIPLQQNYGVFITMNPGYAGRT